MPTGTRRYSTIGGVKVRLAAWVPSDQRYTDRLSPVDPNLQFLPNERSTLVARPASAFWQMNDWKAGEGFDRWKPDREGGGYFRSSNVRPKQIGDGLELGPGLAVSTEDDGTTEFTDLRLVGRGQGTVWAVKDDTAYEWDAFQGEWDTTGGISTGASVNDFATSIADPSDTWLYTGHASNETIRRWKSGSNEEHYGTGTGDDFTRDPVLVVFAQRLFALDVNDLYEIDLVTADTRTLKVDVGGTSNEYLGQNPICYQRLGVSDKGPIWLQRLDNGQTYIWEYNVAQDVGYIVGELPGDITPTSIYFARGFIFVGFVDNGVVTSTVPGDAYVYFQRGAQRGVLGPLRETNDNRGPLAIAGAYGDELLLLRESSLWAYNLSAGGVYFLGAGDAAGDYFTAEIINREVLAATIGQVDRFRLEQYRASGTLDSGLYDLAYTDIPKRLIEVVVVTEPLPADTSVSVAYTTDGETYTALSGAHDVDGESEKSWIVSTSAGATVKGRRFGIRLTLASSDVTETPVVRGVLVRGRTAAHERQIVMAVDCSTDDAGEQNAADVVSGLRALVDAQNVVSFSNTFLGDPEDAAETFDVEVRNLIVPDVENPAERLAATVELVAVGLVT